MKIIHGDTELRRRHLPHLERRGAEYFVTWRLYGTIPEEVLESMRLKAQSLEARAQSATQPPDEQERAARERKRLFALLDHYLDSASTGNDWLKNPDCLETVKQTILDQSDRASIDCFTIMPNHVHLLFLPIPPDTLRSVMKRIKQITAYHCLLLTNTTPPFWEEENYDHIPREGERPRITSYIIRNPVVAGLCNGWKDWSGTYLAEEFDGIDERGFLMG